MGDTNNGKTKKSEKTRFVIMNSFMDIMGGKNLESITVKSIVEKAGITRGTFYLYFSDIYELLGCVEEELLSNIPVMNENVISSGFSKLPTAQECAPTQWEIDIFDFYYQYSGWMNALLGPHGDHQFYGRVKEKMQSNLRNQMSQDGAPNDSFREYFESVIPDIFLILAREWTSNNSLYELDKNALAHIMSTVRIGAKYKSTIERTTIGSEDGQKNKKSC